MIFKNLLNIAAFAASCFVGANADSLPEIEIVGNKFYYSNNGSRFYLKGVAYQQNAESIVNSTDSSFIDPLADLSACTRDVPYLQELETNVIRVYALDPEQDHTGCMQLLEEAGIYVIADLSSPDESINRDDPQWTVELYDRYTSVIDAFQNYTNILGFFAGNEVTNVVSNTNASAFVKAAIRDSKAYLKAKGYRSIPVGYSANDDTDIRVSLADYFACGSDDVRADFFGINMYEWCGTSSFTKSGYSTITNQYENLGIPIFFSEYGCNRVQPRTFQEVGTIYSTEMTDVWSGGIVYMYFEEENKYGLVSVDGSSVSTLSDFSYYSKEIASASPDVEYSSTASSNGTVTSCPTATSNWDASTKLPPTPNKDLCSCMDNAAGCVVDSDVDEEDYEDLFSYVCGLIDCSGITADGSTGKYGAYSPCSSKQRLNFVLNLYYEKNDNSKSACDFSGSASVQKASTASSCTALLSSAGVSGTGSVSGSVNTSKNSSTSSKSSGNSSGSSSNGSSSSSKSSSSSTSSGKSKSSAARQVSTEYLSKMMFVGISVALGFCVILV